MDINMPIMDGIEATRAIHLLHHNSHLPRVPIIAMSAGEGDEKELRAQGFSHIAPKPFSLAKFQELMESLIHT